MATLLAVMLAVSSCGATATGPSGLEDSEEAARHAVHDDADRHDGDNEDREPDPQIVNPPLPLFGQLADDVAVLGVGTYGGPLPGDGSVTTTGRPMGMAQVYVDMPDRPVVLVLSAYEPVLWHVETADDTHVVGVLVSGYHGQALAGVHTDTASFITSYEEPGDFEPDFNVHRPSPELLETNQIVQDLIGKEVESFTFDAVDGIFWVGQPKPESTEPQVEDIRAGDHEPAEHHPAIEELLAQGKLRLATMEDGQAWLDKHNERYASAGVSVATLYLDLALTYVVIDEVELPEGLNGAHAVAFIVPENIPQPDVPKGHNNFYWMADGSTNAELE